MREFYRRTDGTNVPGTSGQDHNAFHFWRLREVQPDEQFRWSFPFLDYREESWRYAVDLTGNGAAGHGAIYILADVPVLVATSFEELAKIYVRNAERLYFDASRMFLNDESAVFDIRQREQLDREAE